MAQKVFVEMVDDLDGTAGQDVTTVTFALDGRTYEIDLNSANASALRESLARYVEAGRRSRRRGRATGLTPTRVPTADSAARGRAQAIRQWADESGQEVAARGRIPSTVVEAYEAARQGRNAPAASTAAVESHTGDKKIEPKTKKSKKNAVTPSFTG
jgi:hypothetical protein